ncbi:Zinc finger protein ZPR1 [Intoshia linei]|uniref:Zinc finger protein ZPR1 n=1 Tax=Intoshia linei TaxID=1819745 RepID=A0A177BB44_9BILA|nr:Zinc finger protein ZPR1 [Intoshia linei]
MDSQSPKIGETISYTQLKDNVTNIQSLCPNCFKTGETKLLLSKIKHFGDIIISSFICDHCHLKNTDVSPSIPIQSSGTRIEITITTKADMNRQVVKTKYARIIVPVLEFEREPSYGEITTIEGLLSNAIIHINKNAKIIAKGNPDVIQNIVEFVEKMQDLMSVKSSWLLIIDDVSGNSYVENIKYPKTDSNLIIMPYFRNKEQNEQVGIFTPQEEYKVGPGFGVEETITNVTTDEVNCMQVSCPNCDAVGQNNVKLVDIPFFKEIILMAFCCDECGFRDSEVKGGLSFDEKGKRLTLTITKKNDLSRDFLTIRSETKALFTI